MLSTDVIKRTTAFVFALMLVFSLPVSVFGAEVSGEVGCVPSVGLGEVVTVSVSLRNGAGIAGIAVAPIYDKEVFELVGGSWSLVGSVSDFNLQTGDGVIAFSGSREINGVFFTFDLRAVGLPNGENSSVGCSVRAAINGGNVTVPTGSATVEIEECVHDLSAQRTDEKYLKKAADCNSAAIYYFSCWKCGSAGTETFVHGTPKHKIKSEFSYDLLQHWRECELCGERFGSEAHLMQGDECTKCDHGTKKLNVSGTVTVDGSSNEIIELSLFRNGESTPSYTMQKTGNSAEFCFENVEKGEYILRISKTKHVSLEIEVSELDESAELGSITLRLYGDVNGDGKVNATDATQIKRFYNNKSSVFNRESGAALEYLKKVADVNGDGKANATDATQIKRYYNNKSSVFDRID